MKNEIVIGIVLLFLGFGIFVFTNRPKDIEPSSYQQTAISPTITPVVTTDTNSGITATEIAKHTNTSSCWMVINGNVYDVTKYITSHPGGEVILLGCGKDATDLFTGVAAMGKRHSNKAQSMLVQLLVGPLVK